MVDESGLSGFSPEPSVGPIGDGFAEWSAIDAPRGRTHLEFGMMEQEMACRGCGIIVDPAGIAAGDVGQIAHDTVGGDDAGAGRHERRIRFQFTSDVRAGVIRIENHQHRFAGADLASYLRNGGGSRRVTFDDRDAMR